MSMLSSVFGRRKNIQKRLNNFAHRIPGRAPSPPSPGSFASPDFDPYKGYAQSSQISLNQPPAQINKQNGGPSNTNTSTGDEAGGSKRLSSPRVQLDFGHDASLSDWFPPEFLHGRSGSEPMMRPERNASLGATSHTSGSLPMGTLGSSSGSVLGNTNLTAASSGLGPSGAEQTARVNTTAQSAGDETERNEGGYEFGEDEVIVIGAPSSRGRDPTPSPLASNFDSPHPHGPDLLEFQDANTSQPHRRPSPIRIPRRTSGVDVRLQRSASLSSMHPTNPERSPMRQAHSDIELPALSRAPTLARVGPRSNRSRSISRPASVNSRYSDTDVDYDDVNSAISGSTLARHLASSYILSPAPSHLRHSRGHLARQDSATLPRGEYGYLFSRRSVRSSKSSTSVRGSVAGNGEKYWRDENVAPPVPPMPEGLSPGFPLSPGLSQTKSGSPNPSSLPARSRRGSPAGLDFSLTASPNEQRGLSSTSRRSSYRTSLGGGVSASGRRLTLDPEAQRRRISRISEGSGSASASAGALSPGQKNGSQVSLPFAGERDKAEIPATMKEEEEQPHSLVDVEKDIDQGQEVVVKLLPHSTHSRSPDAPTTATSASVSVYSRNTSNMTSSHSMVTPGTSSSGSVYSPGSGMTAFLSPGGTSFDIFPELSSGRSALSTDTSSVVIDTRSPLNTASESGASSFSSPKPVVSLLPLGERARSAQVPQSASSQSSGASQDSAGHAHSSSLSSTTRSPPAPASPRDDLDSPDLLDIMLFPVSKVSVAAHNTGESTGGSSRVGSPPAPISVPPIGEGFAVSLDAQLRSTASAARQTFPETPYAFTPLTGKSFGSPALPPSMREVPPPLPRTATVASRGVWAARLRADGGRGSPMKTLSSPPGKLPTTVLTPPPAADVESEREAMAEPDPKSELPIIEETSTPSTPSSRPSSYAVISENSPSSKWPRSLKPEDVIADDKIQQSPVIRPSSLVPAKRPLTPLPSPLEASIPLPASPSSSKYQSPPIPSAELEASTASLSPPGSRHGTPSPIVPSGRLSRRPSGGSEYSLGNLSQGFLTTPDGTPSKRMARSRPPPPSGPRKPSMGPGSTLLLRTRNGSVSSQMSLFAGSAGASSSRYPSMSLSASSPRFQTTPVKFRALTMEAAQWTWTSHQLQEIVSIAIKKSADASAIRLLPLEMLMKQIPEEISRLEATSAETRTSYKLAMRRRRTLLSSLSNTVENGDLAASIRVIQEITELTETLDNLSEELYAITDQLAQLAHLRDVHCSSALAMALRKLNSSFLKHLAEKQNLRNQVLNLEQERDDAWKQAQDAAQEIDALNEKLVALEGTAVPTPANSRRSSRVLVARKASMRVSKAGLRSPSRLRSQRSSVASEAPSTGVRSAGFEDVPPVPPIPIRTSMSIFASGLTSRSSGVTSEGTPSSGIRAMILAQQEICAILGISAEELRNGPIDFRPRSMSAATETPGLAPQRFSDRRLTRHNSEMVTPRSRASDSFPIRRRSRSFDERTAMLATIAGMASP